MAKQKKTLTKKNWRSDFSIIGKIQITEKTFDFDIVSDKGWQYNKMNLGVDCGAKFGMVYVNTSALKAGFNSKYGGKIYANNKDFSESLEIDWLDRNNPDIIADVSNMNIYRLKVNGKDKKYLSQYDLVNDASKELEDGMTALITGTIEYSVRDGSVSAYKIVKGIYVDNYPEDKFKAQFTQTLLIDRDSVVKKEIDKEKGYIPVDGYVLEWFKEFNGHDLSEGDKSGQLVPLKKRFQYKFDPEDPAKLKKIIQKLLKPERGVSQITFEGMFISGGAVVETTIDDLPDDIQELIKDGLMTEEEALADCAGNTSSGQMFVLTRPKVGNVTQADGSTKMIPFVFKEVYDDEDLQLDCFKSNTDDFMEIKEGEEDIIPFDGDDLDDFLDEL